MENKSDDPKVLFDSFSNDAIDKRDDAQFQHEIKKLLQKAEDMRLSYMRKHQTQKMIANSLAMLLLLAGSSGFAWFLLMETDLQRALGSLAAGICLPLLLSQWHRGPVKAYLVDYKKRYLPELAKLMGGFAYSPQRGINENVLNKTGVIPAYKHYHSEDCFRGLYHGSKVMFSEARLTDAKNQAAFQGLLVLVELSHDVFEGHTIITADREMAGQYAGRRWKNLSQLALSTADSLTKRFVAFSDNPDAAALYTGERFLKELGELDVAFGQAGLSAVLFRKRYIFMMIPHEADMFEASSLYIPVSTHKHAITCKKEIDQLLEMIDVIHLYK
jgi:hypothetical protein